MIVWTWFRLFTVTVGDINTATNRILSSKLPRSHASNLFNLPSSATLSPVEYLVHCGHAFSAHGSHITAGHYCIIHARMLGKALKKMKYTLSNKHKDIIMVSIRYANNMHKSLRRMHIRAASHTSLTNTHESMTITFWCIATCLKYWL